jgi:CheY-like chemotaxis protein|tara:strand:- start:76 stop:453 length:378 start_codon:yes stop_codon:yes gene_type:complete
MKHILLIDDNEIDSYISKHMITKKKAPQKISVQSSAIDALEFLGMLKNNNEEFPDHIFVDIQMPVMNGFEFLEEFSKFPQVLIDHCKVIMLTSSSHEQDRTRSFKFPFVKKFITKPLTLDLLEDL